MGSRMFSYHAITGSEEIEMVISVGNSDPSRGSGLPRQSNIAHSADFECIESTFGIKRGTLVVGLNFAWRFYRWFGLTALRKEERC